LYHGQEVIKGFEKMKKHAPGLPGVVTEMLQYTGETRVNWLVELCWFALENCYMWMIWWW